LAWRGRHAHHNLTVLDIIDDYCASRDEGAIPYSDPIANSRSNSEKYTFTD
jgi:hypothetical protein